MTPTFTSAVVALAAVAGRFHAEDIAATEQRLRRLRAVPLRATKALVTYHDCLLFLRAHPSSPGLLGLVESELGRIARFLRRYRGHHPAIREGLGLPFVSAVRQYSHACVRSLMRHPHCAVQFEEFFGGTRPLGEVLRLTLPSIERSMAEVEQSNEELLQALLVPPRHLLSFLIGELSRLDGSPAIKDEFYNALGVLVRVTPTATRFSTAFNRLPDVVPYFQTERLKAVDARALMEQALPTARSLSGDGLADVVQVIRDTMTLTGRETDPATYLDDRSLRVFDLERGISIAVYGMTHDRQLALESYVGFTAFRNGLPVAYGGSWVFGERAEFGMNIFEPYRGGESGYLMCQLLRVYRQLFRIRYFEVDAHQFGLDNPEGIASGAFWFYHRYGFRPTDAALNTLATRERARLTAKPGARSTRQTLRALTGSSVALRVEGPIPPSLGQLAARVTRMVRRDYASDRSAAEQACVHRLVKAARLTPSPEPSERAALAELAMIAGALRVIESRRLRLISAMVSSKPHDVYGYQMLLRQLLRPAAASQSASPGTDAAQPGRGA